MKTIYYISLIILFVNVDSICQSKFYKHIENSKYEKEIYRKFKKLDCYNKKDNYSFLIIYHVELNQYSKDIFEQDLLFENIKYIYGSKESSIPSNETIIYNKSIKAIAYSDDLQVSCIFNNLFYQELLIYSLENDIDFIFRISGTNGMIYFAVKNSITRVIEFNINAINTYCLDIYSLNDFINCCWDKLYLN